MNQQRTIPLSWLALVVPGCLLLASQSTLAGETPPTAATTPAVEAAPKAIEAPAPAVLEAAAAPAVTTETNCTDHVDEDGDTVVDCADHDCAQAPACQPDGKPEADDGRCSNWIDDDKDGQKDCEDSECERTAVCQGSWQGDIEGDGGSAAPVSTANASGNEKQLSPEIEGGDSNDGVGFVGVRFGITALGVQSLTFDNTKDPKVTEAALDTRLQVLQLRAFGKLPLLEDSFFLINLRGDRSPRLTYAMFQVPIAGSSHSININTGGGTLSNQLIISTAKLPFFERANYMFSAFEQGNGLAAELNGPIVRGILRYRAFAGGGAGFTTGNVGGRRFAFDNYNYTFTLGGQLQFTPIGYYSRFDSPYLYRPVPMQLAINAGVKWDQRQQERYPAFNGQLVFRWGIFEAYLEDYVKAEFNYGSIQNAYNIMVGVLLWPEWLFAAADFGQFWTSGFGTLEQVSFGGIQVADPPDQLETELRRQRGETQARVALHFYFWRNNGVLSLRHALRLLDPPLVGRASARDELFVTNETWLAAQFRF